MRECKVCGNLLSTQDKYDKQDTCVKCRNVKESRMKCKNCGEETDKLMDGICRGCIYDAEGEIN